MVEIGLIIKVAVGIKQNHGNKSSHATCEMRIHKNKS